MYATITTKEIITGTWLKETFGYLTDLSGLGERYEANSSSLKMNLLNR